MLKLLLLCLAIYVGFKLYRVFSTAKVIINNYNFPGQEQQHKKEGEVTISQPGQTKKAGKKDTGPKGDYIDYEEIS